MRLYLLPISTRRTLLYCQKLNAPTTERPTWGDWIQSKASRTWAGWEKKERGWQKSVVNYGNYAFRRIPYEEWGLKSVPPLSQRRRVVERNGSEKIEVVYPKSLLAMDKVPGILETLATERQSLHKRRLIWCLVGMPITAPIALIPVIPNLPFFYLVYRAWSHWRALAGGKHVQFLVQQSLLSLTPSPVVDEVYAAQKLPLPSTPQPTTDAIVSRVESFDPSSEERHQHPEGETMLLSQANGKKMTQALDLPQLEVELERAIWQVETAIKKQNAALAQADSGPASAKGASESDTAPKEEGKKSQ
ncbi:mitochondrial K+-H+ exchange-related-domain-containing protein [Lasiosphaeria miniovina]|uniref:Mitochondrial K+-H+ exchange-related-domain-containing protein n=1 Tax=Lasiosphaeria miniovina TaxID=1954250 RepID=A0AA39ZQ91_9PEZI|nr:mitochondrial K+-H+ exchange-related-domain-containing protein [Lasiosphaeria miniovina]KAK0701672.1 mitochondrial K+-H+ exchange-related-domain-containing protein [Lasiosphaeria miniovina]